MRLKYTPDPPLFSNRSMLGDTSPPRFAERWAGSCCARHPASDFQRLLAVRVDLSSSSACADSPLTTIWNGAPDLRRIVRVKSASLDCRTPQQDRTSMSHRSNLQYAPNHFVLS